MSNSPAMPAAQNAGGMEGTSATCRAGGQHSKSMHDGVPVWHDCCSCEAEPYWAEMDEAADCGAAGDDN